MDWFDTDYGYEPVVVENNGPGFFERTLDKLGSLAGNAWGAWTGSQAAQAQAAAAGQQQAMLAQQQQAYAQQQQQSRADNQKMMMFGFMGLLALAFLLRQTKQA